MKLLFHSSAPVDAELAAVRELIDNGWLLQRFFGGGEQPPSAEQPAQHLDASHSPGKVGFQGDWWYRGELEATAGGGETLINYRVYNIAKRAAWAVPLANRLFIGFDAGVQKTTNDLARAIELHLKDKNK